ncbi:MAG: DUF1684 domain-containing protein [Anaerolineales bacterium]|nr:DUF1684 domain-containing protein [Anaerolineales bacterium]
MNSDHLSTLSAWREDMGERLRAPYGWLALTGLFWLEDGENSLGSAPGSVVQLPARAPAALGSLWLAGGQVTLHPAPGAALRIDEHAVHGATLLQDDHAEQPTFLFWEDVRLLVLRRANKFALRVWDPQRRERQTATGRVWFPPDPAAQLVARIERYDPPVRVLRDDITGAQLQTEMHAALHFEYGGVHCAPQAELLEDGSYYLLVRDGTSGKTSYGAGRFLTSEQPTGDEVVLDLNKLYSPPCAFTEFATCPLPQPSNVLAVTIEAGERYDGAH